MTISEMLARNARMYPDDSALIELKPSKKIRKEITWKEFDERANRVANALIDRGVSKADKVIHWMMDYADASACATDTSIPGNEVSSRVGGANNRSRSAAIRMTTTPDEGVKEWRKDKA